MKRKRAIILLICICITCIFAGLLTACGGEEDYAGVKVVFELEGGRYKNSRRAPTYYYDLAPGASAKILTPDDYAGDTKNKVDNPGYRIESWCKTKTVDEETGEVTYTDPWDFENDTINSETGSLTLYAKWKENFSCYYELCYRDDSGAVQTIASYLVAEGTKFSSYHKTNAERDAADAASDIGCTVKKELVNGKSQISFYTETGEAWDADFTHPGDDEEKAHVSEKDDGSKAFTVRVFVEFIKGEFTFVSTASELNSAAARGSNIVLMCDIDFGGGKFNGFADATSRVYGGKTKQIYLDGKGFAIKNFALGYTVSKDSIVSDATFSNSLIVSLFGIASNVKVTDVSFTGVTIDLSADYSGIGSIYVTPLAVQATNCIFERVNFEGTFHCTKLPKGFTSDNLFVDGSEPIHLGTGETNTVTDVKVSLQTVE